ncbi:hypothetical protein D3C86_1887710 [compost metagenome]
MLAAIGIGEGILLRVPIRSLRLKMVSAALLGVLVLLLLQAIPWVGGLVAVLALMAGLGAPAVAFAYRLARGT